MKIVKMKGGLGNQLFQYCFAKALNKKTGEIVKLDFSSYSSLKNDTVRVPRIKKLKISLEEADDLTLKQVLLLPHLGNSQAFLYRAGIYFEKIINKKYLFEKDRSYRPIDLISNYDYFDGYWLNWKYVEYVFSEVKEEFKCADKISNKAQEMIANLSEENSVFIGVRRGDYEKEKKHYGSFGQDYYDRAIEIIKERVKNPVFYIFSNDIDWVKKNMNFEKYHPLYREKIDITDDFEEFLIMQSCKHFIIVNSTFHWWAAKLCNNQEKIVIAPKCWFADDKPIDIIPPEWIAI